MEQTFVFTAIPETTAQVLCRYEADPAALDPWA